MQLEAKVLNLVRAEPVKFGGGILVPAPQPLDPLRRHSRPIALHVWTVANTATESAWIVSLQGGAH